MGGNKPQAAQWRAASTDNRPIVAATDGDGLDLLRRVRDKYLAKARYVELLGYDPGFYLRAAAAVTRLLGDVAADTIEVTFALAIPEQAHA
jgi:hypothetical protein